MLQQKIRKETAPYCLVSVPGPLLVWKLPCLRLKHMLRKKHWKWCSMNLLPKSRRTVEQPEPPTSSKTVSLWYGPLHFKDDSPSCAEPGLLRHLPTDFRDDASSSRGANHEDAQARGLAKQHAPAFTGLPPLPLLQW